MKPVLTGRSAIARRGNITHRRLGCSFCSHEFSIPAQLRGKLRCPRCRGVTKVSFNQPNQKDPQTHG